MSNLPPQALFIVVLVLGGIAAMFGHGWLRGWLDRRNDRLRRELSQAEHRSWDKEMRRDHRPTGPADEPGDGDGSGA